MPTLWHDKLFNGVIGSILACPKFPGNGLNLPQCGVLIAAATGLCVGVWHILMAGMPQVHSSSKAVADFVHTVLRTPCRALNCK